MPDVADKHSQANNNIQSYNLITIQVYDKQHALQITYIEENLQYFLYES